MDYGVYYSIMKINWTRDKIGRPTHEIVKARASNKSRLLFIKKKSFYWAQKQVTE